MHQNACEEMFFKEQEMVFDFCFNELVDEGTVFVNSSELKDMASFGETAIGSMKMT
jgi:hypothetical protein